VWSDTQVADLTEEQKAFVDRIQERRVAEHVARFGSEEGLDLSTFGTFYGGLLTVNPELAWHIHDLGRIWRTAALRGSMTGSVREWVDLVVSWELREATVFYGHLADFVAVGGRPEAIDALVNNRLDELTEDERAQHTLILQTIDGQVTDEAYKKVLDRIGVQSTVELVAFSAYLCFICRIFSASGFEQRPSWQAVMQLVEGLKARTVELPDPMAGVA
jgi:hypothetical protein